MRTLRPTDKSIAPDVEESGALSSDSDTGGVEVCGPSGAGDKSSVPQLSGCESGTKTLGGRVPLAGDS